MVGFAATGPNPRLTTFSHIRDYLRTSPQPVFYLSRTATNLLSVERWVDGLSFIALVDSWDGQHPRVFVPSNVPRIEPRGNVNIINWLLRNPQVHEHVAEHTPAGLRPRIVAVFFDETTERLCRELGYDLALPPVAVRDHLDSKIVTTQVGDAAGVKSVPNILTRVTNWADLAAQANAAGLGSDLVVQTAYGDSGRTTFFLSSESDFARVANLITKDVVKVMKRIDPLTLAVEAVITRHGVVLGPCLREVNGHKELTRYPGGWCGNEMAPDIVSPEIRREAFALTKRFSEQLAREGYRGIHDVSLLVDRVSGDVYLGEVNARISGSSTHANLVPQPDEALPLFAFHLLEFSDAEFDLDVDGVSKLLEVGRGDNVWSSMIIQHTEPAMDFVTKAPKTGRYRIRDDGSLDFVAEELDWTDLTEPNEVFVLRILGEGNYRSHGSDIAVVFTRIPLQEPHNALRPEAKALIRAVQDLFESKPVSQATRVSRAVTRRIKMRLESIRGR